MSAAGLLWLLLAAPPAAATDPDVAQGLALFGALEYDRAVVVLGRALTKPDLAASDERSALEALAFSYTVLDDAVHGAETFGRLLDRDPSFEVDPSRSPRLRQGFARAKEAWLAGRRISVALDPDPSRISLRLSGDPARVGEVVAIDEAEHLEGLRCERRSCVGVRPPRPFRIEVRDHRGAPLASAGPFAGAAVEEAPFPWWAYLAIGAGIVATGAIVIGAALPQTAPNGSLGRFELP